jgi:DNA topoisomerase-2
VPSGQFGTRLKGGEDSASERYIFTLLNKITRTIFPQVDDHILTYLTDDGTPVEPIYYVPIIPMVLVNGSKGIGTGFSTDIMCYNPIDIIAYLKRKLSGESVDNMTFVPYYEGFQGTIEPIVDNSKFIIKCKYETVGPDKIRVTELPVGYWTDDFKEHLENLIDPGQDKEGKKLVASVKEYQDMSKDTTVDFTITLAKGKLAELEAISADHGCNGVHKLFKLTTTNTTTNMHLFDANDKLKKYSSVSKIIDDYFDVRLDAYKRRKEYMIKAIEQELVLLSNKVKYIREILNDTVDLRKKTKEQIHEMLQTKGYTLINDDYRYLIKLPMDSVTEENVASLTKEHDSKVAELETVQKTTIEQLWLTELNTLVKQYEEYKEERNRMTMGELKSKKKVIVKKTKLIIEESTMNKTNIVTKTKLIIDE